MANAATIGAATVVDENQHPLPDKYQSYMRGLMRSAAEVNHRNPLIAEGMVTPNNALPQIADSGKIITLTTSEAIANGFCNAEANSIDDVVHQMGFTDFKITEYESSWTDDLIGWLTSPMVSSLLILIIIGGLYFEFQHPGIGLPLFACIIGALLYFAPLYLDGLAQNWEILLFLLGLILIVLEIFVVPGFGITGISGIVFLISGLSLSLIRNNNLDFSYGGASDIVIAMLRVSVMFLIAIVGGVFFGGNIFKTDRMKKFVLTDTQPTTDFVEQNMSMKNKTGFAQTDLRPAGKVLIDEKLIDAHAEKGFIAKGELIIVLEQRSNYLVVRKQA